LLRGLAIKNDLAVVLIAHPSLSGMASGSGTSGSTAWSNSVRARLYLERIVDEGNREIDPDLRVLRVKKSNYGPVGLELPLRWQNGGFIVDGPAGGFDKIAAEANTTLAD
jgi:RecA-family ATPase